MGQTDIESLLNETRVFNPPAAFSAEARCKSLEEYQTLYDQSINDPDAFWSNVARELHWFEPWQKVLDWKIPHAQWFVGGKTNLSYNCLDRHLDGPRADKVAYNRERMETHGARRAAEIDSGRFDNVQRCARVLIERSTR